MVHLAADPSIQGATRVEEQIRDGLGYTHTYIYCTYQDAGSVPNILCRQLGGTYAGFNWILTGTADHAANKGPVGNGCDDVVW